MTTRRAQGKRTMTTLINGGTTPVIYSDDGRTLAAGSRVEVESIDDTARSLLELGYITVADQPGGKDSGDHDEQEGPGASDPESDS